MSDEKIHEIIDQSPKIVNQILQKVLAGDKGGVTLNIFIIYNNDGQFGKNGNGAKTDTAQIQHIPKIEGTWFGRGIEKYHLTEELLRKALAEANWSQSGAARILQIPRYIVRSRCERWNIRGPED